MEIEIPKRYEAGLAALIQLDEEKRAKFLSAIRDQPAALNLDKLASEVAIQLSVEEHEASSMLNALTSLFLARSKTSQPARGFAENVIAAAIATGKSKLDPTQAGIETFTDFLKEALSYNESFGVTARARELAYEQQNLYCTGRLLTDIRPVFRPDIIDTPVAATVVHNLHISYHQGGDYKDFYISLDHEDILNLKQILERALQKENSLKVLMAKLDLTVFDLEEHH